jgi:hypothetical protein
METWKDVVGYLGKYQVSNHGNVRSLNYRGTGRTKVMKQANHSDGYKVVGLTKNGKQTSYKVHRLVAQTFLSEFYSEDCIVHHIDEDRSNNNAANLECCDQAKNISYTRGQKRIYKRLTELEIEYLLFLYKTGEFTNGDLATKFKITRQTVFNVLNGVTRTA